MSLYLHKSHNVSCLIYHVVCPTKYRRVVISEQVDETIKQTCLEIAKRYDLHFLEIGTDKDHVHFLIQSVPMILPKNIVQTIKSITAREVFRQNPEVKKNLWGGAFWGTGYFINTVGRANSEAAVSEYVRNQGREGEYVKIHSDQLKLFEGSS
jgi:REP element-mobilizing transposase RayT